MSVGYDVQSSVSSHGVVSTNKSGTVGSRSRFSAMVGRSDALVAGVAEWTAVGRETGSTDDEGSLAQYRIRGLESAFA